MTSSAQQARKRTALYELVGDFDGDDLSIIERGELPSAGDTAYAGVAPIEPSIAPSSSPTGVRYFAGRSALTEYPL